MNFSFVKGDNECGKESNRRVGAESWLLIRQASKLQVFFECYETHSLAKKKSKTNAEFVKRVSFKDEYFFFFRYGDRRDLFFSQCCECTKCRAFKARLKPFLIPVLKDGDCGDSENK